VIELFANIPFVMLKSGIVYIEPKLMDRPFRVIELFANFELDIEALLICIVNVFELAS
jgi:hypothetical protein